MIGEPTALVDLAARLRREGAAGYLEELRGRFAELEDDVQAFLPEPGRFERLLDETGRIDADAPESLALLGVPVGVKDIFHVDGFVTRAGCRLPEEALQGAESAAVAALRRAGALVLGKTVTTEFAYFAPGQTRNPHDLERTPGGSSSGSAAAVAAGLAPLALGTQTIGSIGRPASYCGVVGFKPTYGRVPTEGVIPLAPSVDHVGFFTSDVRGAALAASVLCAGWREGGAAGGGELRPYGDRHSHSLAGGGELRPYRDRHSDSFVGAELVSARRPAAERGNDGSTGGAAADLPAIGVPTGPYLDRADGLMLETFEAALESLEAAGCRVHQLPVLRDFQSVVDRHRALVAAEALEVHRDWYGRYPDLYRRKTAELLEAGRLVTPAELERARAGRAGLREQLEEHAAELGIDLWASPAAPGAAPAGRCGTGDPIMNLPWTHAGVPTLSLPMNRAAIARGELPLGLQLAGSFGEDEKLLAWAARVEEILAP